MSQRAYDLILRVGVYLAFVSVFLVNKNYLFPFITSKQIYFNILIEILVVFWVALIIKYPERRPKKSLISFGLIAFFAALIISAIFGVDWNLSFWGDIERMLGVFPILHFLFFYFIIITVLRTKEDWRWFMAASVATAVMNSLWGMTLETKSTTIGNTAYVSGYMIFNIYFAILLFTQEKNWYIKSAYILAIIPMFTVFWNAHTSGAIVGLGASLMLALFLLIILGKNKKIRLAGIISVIVFTALVAVIFTNRNHPWITNSPIAWVARDVSFQKNTFQTRLISWRGAAKDFKNHPIIGVGHGNYANIFDKHFDPTFFNYTRSETYFDRAHNNVIDIASTAGILGLLAYLSIFAAVAYYLIKSWRQRKLNLIEFVLLSGLIVAYFIQNLAVFDSLVTYISLMIVLGYIYFAYNQGERTVVRDSAFNNKELSALLIVGLVMLAIMYQYNYKVSNMLKATIDGQRSWSQGDVLGTFEHYKKALSYQTVLDRDSRSTFMRLFSNGPAVFTKIDSQKAEEIINFATEAAEKNLEYNPGDSMMQLEYAQLLISVASYYYSDKEKFNHFVDRALEATNRAIEASPGRAPVYFVKAQIYLMKNETEQAIETLKYAVSLNEDYYDSHCQLANTYLYYKQEEEGYKAMDKCLATNGATLLSPVGYVKNLANHYASLNDWEKVAKLYMRITELAPSDANAWADLAKVYANAGDKVKAEEAALKAVELNPEFRTAAEEFITGLNRD